MEARDYSRLMFLYNTVLGNKTCVSKYLPGWLLNYVGEIICNIESCFGYWKLEIVELVLLYNQLHDCSLLFACDMLVPESAVRP